MSMIISLVLLLVSWGFFSVYPMKSLLLLEFLYLILLYLLVEVSFSGWWLMLVVLFSACEGVFLLTVYMILGMTLKNSKMVKFYMW